MNARTLNIFYYLAPAWFLLETFLWPNFRAGLVVGNLPFGNALFYAVEGGLGAALWFKLPLAETGVLIENVIYLTLAMKFIIFTPMDVTLMALDGADHAAILAKNYTASLPGIIYSMFQVGIKISAGLMKGGSSD